MTVNYKVAKAVQVPTLSFKKIKELFFKAEGPLHEGKRIANDDPEKKPATIMRIVNLDDGALYDLIVPTVLAGTLSDNYENDSYVGKCFRAAQVELPGKKYKGFQVDEITVEADEKPAKTK